MLDFVISVQKTNLWRVQIRELRVYPPVHFASPTPLTEMADDCASSEKHKGDVVTSELVIQADTENVYDEHDSLDPVYAAKAKILNDSLQEIGMGKYQVRPSLNAMSSTSLC